MQMRKDELLATKGVTVAFAHPTPKVDWKCAGSEDPEVFDPADDDALAAAVQVCDGCAVKSLCYALGTSRDEWGVWGGVLLEDGKPLTKVRKRGRPARKAAPAA